MNISPIAGYRNLTSKNSPKNTFRNTNSSYMSFVGNDVLTLRGIKNVSPNSTSQIINFRGVESSVVEEVRDLEGLYAIMASGEKAQRFIGELTEKPKDSKQNVQNLLNRCGLNKIEGLNEFSKWSLSSYGYYGAYEKFVKSYFRKAASIEELLRFQPNWGPWKLEEKAWELSNPQHTSASDSIRKKVLGVSYHSVREIPFHIGTLPDVFQSEEVYESLVRKLKTEDIQAQSINFNGVSYNIRRLNGGEFTDKFIYLLETDGKKFILKFDRMNVEDAQNIDGRTLSLAEKRAIRRNKNLNADSIYSNACISKYLELNGCDLVPKLHYYDHKTHSAVFEYVEDINSDGYQQGELGDGFFGLNQMNSNYQQLNSLGIYLNDTSRRNVLKTANGVEKIIDLGHCRFMDALKPGVRDYNVEFSNSNGPDVGSYSAALLRAIQS